MSSRPFFLKKGVEYKQELERELRKDSADHEKILERWSSLKESAFEDEEEHADQVKADILLVVSSLRGRFDLIRHLNLVLPLGFNVSCYPDAKNTSHTNYFTLLSNPYGSPWGEIYPTTQENDQPLEPCVSMHELNIAIASKASWEFMVKAGESGGWSGCLLDMLTWEIQSTALEQGFKEMAIRIQAELTGRIQQLPFTTYYDLPIEKLGSAPDGPSENCFKCKIAGQDTWAQKIDVGDTFDQKANIEAALALLNFRHPRLVAWTSVYSDSPKARYLVTRRERITNLETFYKGKWTKSNRFKLDAIKDMSEAAILLKSTRSWRNFGMADIFVDGTDANRCYLSHSSLAPTPAGGAYSRDEDMAVALNTHYAKAIGKIVHMLYDSDTLPALPKSMKSVALMVRSINSPGREAHLERIGGCIDNELEKVPPEDMVEPEEEVHSESEATLVSTSGTLTPTEKSSVSPSTEQEKKRSSFGLKFSLRSRSKADSPGAEPRDVNKGEKPVGSPKKGRFSFLRKKKIEDKNSA